MSLGFTFGTPNPTPTPSLFGAPTPSTTSNPSLFGTTSTPSFGSATPSTTSLFGASTPASSTTAPSLFGVSTSTPTTTTPNINSLYGSSTSFNTGSASLFPTTAPSLAPSFNLETTFSALPDQTKKELEQIQQQINEQKNIQEEISQRNKSNITRIRDEVDILAEKLTTLVGTLDSDIQAVNAFKKEVTKELKNAEAAARAIERLRSPALMYSYPSYPTISPYFVQLYSVFERRIQQYNQYVEELAKFIQTTESRANYSPAMLQEIMRNQYQFFVALAAHVATFHESVAELKQAFLSYRKRYHGDSTDPFEQADRLQQRKSILAKKINAAKSMPATPSANTTTSLSVPTTPSTPSTTSSLFPSSSLTTTTTSSLFPSTSTPTSATPSMFGASSTNLFGSPAASTPGGFSTTPGGFSTTPGGFSMTPTAASTPSGNPSKKASTRRR